MSVFQSTHFDQPAPTYGKSLFSMLTKQRRGDVGPKAIIVSFWDNYCTPCQYFIWSGYFVMPHRRKRKIRSSQYAYICVAHSSGNQISVIQQTKKIQYYSSSLLKGGVLRIEGQKHWRRGSFLGVKRGGDFRSQCLCNFGIANQPPISADKSKSLILNTSRTDVQ